MDYRLHHVGLLCQDLEESLAVYRDQLGSQLISRWYNRGLVNVACVGNGTDATVELVGPPFMDYEKAQIARQGYTLNHCCFLVEDVDSAFAELRDRGVEVAWEPADMLIVRQCGFRDQDGLLFEVFSFLDPEMPMATPDLSAPARPTDLRLHHVSLLTPDLPRMERFYTEMLGMRTLIEYRIESGGFVFLADPFFDLDTHNFTLEIIGPPGLEPREIEMLERHGPCLDHLCYVADDAKGAWRDVVAKGGENVTAPVCEYDSWISWVKDADGIDVEIMTPLPDDVVAEALRSGQPFQIPSE